MKTTLQKLALFTAAVAVGLGTVNAQTAYFTNFTGGDWNVAANWDLDFGGINGVPAEATNASISTVGAVTIDYNAPMAAASFGALIVDGSATLNINAAGFTQDLGLSGLPSLTLGFGVINVGASGVWTATNGGAATIGLGGTVNIAGAAFLAPTAGFATSPLTISAGGALNVETGGELTLAEGGTTSISGTVGVSGTMLVTNSGNFSLLTGSSLTVNGGSLLLSGNTASVNIGEGTSSDNNAGATFTNNAGSVVFDQQLVIRSRDTRFALNGGTLDLLGGLNHNCSGNDSRQWFLINGGTANLGDVTINRAATSGGLRIQDGVVNSTSTRIGIGVAAGYTIMTGGIWTNAGLFYVGDRADAANSGSRRVYFRMDGGELHTMGTEGIVINNQGDPTTDNLSNSGGTLDVNGGTIFAEGVQLNGPNVLANNYARFELSGGTMYLGTVGLVANTAGDSMTAVFTLTGGTLAAKDHWTSSANLPLGGDLTFQAADAVGTAYNITLDGVLSSGGGIIKTGAGSLTLNGANNYSGATAINEGSLVLGAIGSLLNTPLISVATGATFDVSAAGFTLGNGRTLAGSGTVVGNFAADTGATVSPGLSEGTLFFAGNLTENGGVLNVFEISASTNDFIEVGGNLDISAGVNPISVIALGGSLAPGTYSLIHYAGTLIGDVSNLDLVGAPGYLTNNTTTKTIQLVTTGARAATSVVWVGNPTENVWDVVGHTNWLNGAVLDVFVQGDAVRFDNTGSANPNVDIVNNVASASVTVDATANYTFSGTGALIGTGGLTKTNTGTLSIGTLNSYTGPTIVLGGVLDAASLANGGSPSAIGASGNDAANLVIDGGTLSYPGATVSTDRGATIGTNGATIGVTTADATLTFSGSLTGDGSLTKTGAGVLALTAANSYTNGTVISDGGLALGAATSAGSGPITNQNGAVLRLAGSYTMGNNLDFSGTGAVDLNNNVPSGDRHMIGEWTGNATIYITNMFDVGRTFTIGGNGGLSTLTGVIDLVDSNMRLRFNNAGGNPATGSPNVHFKLGTGAVIMEPRNGGITIDLGAVEGGPNTILRGRASGASGLVTYSVGALNLDTVFAGAISNSQAAGNLTALVKLGTGKLTLTGVSTHTGTTVIDAGILQVDGVLGNTFVNVNGGTLAGTGSIDGAVSVNFGATLSPGASLGTLTLNGFLTLGGDTVIEVNKGVGHDQVIINGGASFGGTLTVNNIGGPLAPGDSFQIFTPGGFGEFFSIVGSPGIGLVWNFDPNSGLLSAVADGVLLNVTQVGNDLQFSWADPTYLLQAQTNTLSVGLSDNWVDYPDGNVSPVTVPINPNNGAVFFRLFQPQAQAGPLEFGPTN